MSPPLDPRQAGIVVSLGLATGACDSFSEPKGQEVPPSEIVEPAPTRTPFTPPSFGGSPAELEFEPPPPPACPDGESDADGGPNALLPYAISHADVGRSVLYSWTTPDQIEELRADPTLLTRSATATGERGRASDVIAQLAANGDELALVLAGPDYERKRFAWTNPWATLLGWAGENYGDQLLEIRLKPESLIGHLDRRSAVWAFYDVDNVPVDTAFALANPERIAAIYFVDDLEVSHCGGTFGSGPAYREYVVCNEAMIASWSTRTEAILDELLRAITALGELQNELGAIGCRVADGDLACWREHVTEVWQRQPRGLRESYEAALTFPNDLYMPSANNIERLVDNLGLALFEPAPLTHLYP